MALRQVKFLDYFNKNHPKADDRCLDDRYLDGRCLDS